jgi:hypothetical protein
LNVLQVLCDLLDLVEEMNAQLAAHTHGPTPVPSNAVAFAGAATGAATLRLLVKPITL